MQKNIKSNSGYSINTINGIHSESKLFLMQVGGASTRHIEFYTNWFRFIKLLKNHIEEKTICSFFITFLNR